LGNVGRDPVFKYTQSGVAVCDFSVAVTRRMGSGENRTEKTTWFRVTCWRNLAEIANQYVRKGTQILVEGTVEVNAYISKQDNSAQASLELTADTFQLVGRRDDNSQSSSGEYAAPPSDMSDIPF
jgi:single-strand DNA-binding protein